MVINVLPERFFSLAAAIFVFVGMLVDYPPLRKLTP